jgi:hypothetical protein
MRFPGNKKLVVGAAGLTLLSGGAGALAATQLSSSNPRQAVIDDVANRLNVTPAALTSAMKQALIDRIDAAQKAGGLTAAQASAAKSRIENGSGAGGLGFGFLLGPSRSGPGRFGPAACGPGSTTTPCPGGPSFGPRRGFGPRGGFGMGSGFGPRAFSLGGSAVTGYLGISAATLRSDLVAGKSLAQIASATPGKSVAGLESAMTAAAKTRLDKAVAAGRITSTQEGKRLAALSARLPTLVNRSFKLPAGGPLHRFRVP